MSIADVTKKIAESLYHQLAGLTRAAVAGNRPRIRNAAGQCKSKGCRNG